MYIHSECELIRRYTEKPSNLVHLAFETDLLLIPGRFFGDFLGVLNFSSERLRFIGDFELAEVFVGVASGFGTPPRRNAPNAARHIVFCVAVS
mmetsp:Transcript_81809/g.128841  ORF Transcript_81809/g.128841 Transcript_81809/m.128841 type:complete len:93 (+) Transcript_81809:184-462(+)